MSSDRSPRPRLVVITGPTASGKSALALELAEAMGGEIVSADSMQVYRGLDIGTAKPTAADRARVPHHLIDVADPPESYNAGRFRAEAARAIAEIHGRGRPVVVCGGTALYLKALLEGLAEGPARAPEVRQDLESAWDRGEGGQLFAALAAADPALAARLSPRDRTRVIRGLEVWRVSGRPLSDLQAAHRFADRPYEALRFGVQMPRADLYRRIDARVLAMVRAGWVEEVAGLLAAGVPPGSPALQAIGYREICRHLLEGGELAGVVASIQQATRNYAKRQLTWFRRMELCWVPPAPGTTLLEEAKKFLQTRSATL